MEISQEYELTIWKTIAIFVFHIINLCSSQKTWMDEFASGKTIAVYHEKLLLLSVSLQ